jgi:transcriptional regulator with XRE-family HTH domain
MIDLIELGNIVRQLRRLNKLTQIKLGNKCGLTNVYISFIEKAKYNSISFKAIAKLAFGLNIESRHLLILIIKLSETDIQAKSLQRLIKKRYKL